MAKNNVIPSQKIQDAANGNPDALREILHSLANTSNLQLTATNTGGKGAPPQVRANVSFLNNQYYVQITNPGAITPVSGLQASQASQNATQQSNIESVTPIYHQIRVATSPRFSIADNVQTFGGDTGSTQTYWTISSLGTGRWYFQVRSSYDGSNWNLWRNANGGQTITGGLNGIVIEKVTAGAFALFSLPGDQLFAVGGAYAYDGGAVGVPVELYSSALKSITGPNGYDFQPSNLAHGIIANQLRVLVPDPQPATSGPADFAMAVSLKYEDGLNHIWSGSANVFMVAWNPLGANVVEAITADGSWHDFTLPGGGHLTIGQGITADGANIALPATMPWVDPSRFLSIVSTSYGYNPTRQARGITLSKLAGATMQCQFQDTTDHIWSANGAWLVIAYSPGFPVVASGSGNYLIFTLPSGQRVCFGAGVGANGSTITLPAGFSSDRMYAIATPAGADETSHPMAGVFQCDVNTQVGGAPMLQLVYTDTQNNSWNGAVNYMVFCWES